MEPRFYKVNVVFTISEFVFDIDNLASSASRRRNGPSTLGPERTGAVRHEKTYAASRRGGLPCQDPVRVVSISPGDVDMMFLQGALVVVLAQLPHARRIKRVMLRG